MCKEKDEEEERESKVERRAQEDKDGVRKKERESGWYTKETQRRGFYGINEKEKGESASF